MHLGETRVLAVPVGMCSPRYLFLVRVQLMSLRLHPVLALQTFPVAALGLFRQLGMTDPALLSRDPNTY